MSDVGYIATGTCNNIVINLSWACIMFSAAPFTIRRHSAQNM